MSLKPGAITYMDDVLAVIRPHHDKIVAEHRAEEAGRKLANVTEALREAQGDIERLQREVEFWKARCADWRRAAEAAIDRLGGASGA